MMILLQSSFTDPALAGIPEWTRFENSNARAVFSFDAGGNRAKQFLERTFANGDRAIVNTRYLGSYEQEVHATDTVAGGGYWSVPRKSWTGNKDGTFPMRLTSARREWAPPKLVGAGRGCAGYGVPFAVNPQPIHSLS